MQNKRFWSETYQRFLQFRVTTSVIKEVNRLKRGIDEYLERTPNDKLLYSKAIKIKRNMRWLQRSEARNAAIAELEASAAIEHQPSQPART